jgi:hypothetical protein
VLHVRGSQSLVSIPMNLIRFSEWNATHKQKPAMNVYSRLKWYFFVLRNPVLSKLFKRKPISHIVPHTPENVKILIALTVAELCTSKSARYSYELLQILRSVPDHELDADESAKAHFGGHLPNSLTVHESVECCQTALLLCLSASL